jgi:hypothetical protein
MKTILLAMSAVSAMAVAAPAAAQYRTSYPDRYQDTYQDEAYGQIRAGGDVDARIDRLQARLDADVQQGTISQRESWTLRRQLRELRQLSRQYGMDGLSAGERADLQQRLRYVRDQIQVADRGTDGRYGRADRYGAYDNRAYVGANGNGYYGQGGPYEEVDQADICRDRGGVAGLVDNIVGGGCLRVGQRATADLGGVPYEYRGQYRDGGGVYYRSDGRAIYRIDTRTNTIVGVYPMAR